MLSYYKNEEGESGLYLAAKAGFANCVSLILEQSRDQELIEKLFKENSPIKAAIWKTDIDVLEVILNKHPSFIHLRDAEGNTPLHHAVSVGSLEVVHYLLDKHVPNNYQRDNNGSCPIHLASTEGHVNILSLLLQYCPAPGELLDRYGCNILHLASENGRNNVVKYILDNPEFDELLNMKTVYGNTPLHLATIAWHPKIVSSLTWDKRVDIKLVNHRGNTALDVAEYYMDKNPPFRERLTWSALQAAGTPRSTLQKFVRRAPHKNYSTELFRERVNTLLLVATLVATITFAAGFTMPGGYSSAGTDQGMETMLGDRGFHVFVLCDTIAMHCSIVVVVALVFAQLGDLNLVLNALNLALPLLGIALCMMSMAFTAGVSLGVRRLGWLATVVLAMGFSFLTILVILLSPLCMSLSSSNRILRYISYYAFHWMILATNS